MNEVFNKAHEFMLANARLLERRIFQVRYEGAPPETVASVIRAYLNPDGGLGNALEPDSRCSESQPIFVEFGLSALEEAGCRDVNLAQSLCNYVSSVSTENGLLQLVFDNAKKAPVAEHMRDFRYTPHLNPTAGICGFLFFQGVKSDWLSRAAETCCKIILENPQPEAHVLRGASCLAKYIPDRKLGEKLYKAISSALPKASFFIPHAPVTTYGLTPLDFALKPGSYWDGIFTKQQIEGHLHELLGRQSADGGWPIDWKAPGEASTLEWRGRFTLNAINRLSDYGWL